MQKQTSEKATPPALNWKNSLDQHGKKKKTLRNLQKLHAYTHELNGTPDSG